MKQRLRHLVLGTRGGPNRAGILRLLRAEPRNAHALAEALNVDYKTIRHHLRVLRREGLVMASEEASYAREYRLAPWLENHWEDFLAIWGKLEGPEEG